MMAWFSAVGLDLVAGEPKAAIHPVVLSGRWMSHVARCAPDTDAGRLVFGAGLVLVPATAAAIVGALAKRIGGVSGALAVIWLLKTTFALRELLAASTRVERDLRDGDIDRARDSLAALVSRERSSLDAPHIASAAIESLAENLSDSYVAPLFFYALAGLPGALAYRVVNTADAMFGYHGAYEHLGKASALLDDVLNMVPSRLTAAAIAISASDRSRAITTIQRDAERTESPNAGWPMAAAAGALDVRLEKPGHYTLGAGRSPGPDDIARARTLVARSAMLATAAFALVAFVRRR